MIFDNDDIIVLNRDLYDRDYFFDRCRLIENRSRCFDRLINFFENRLRCFDDFVSFFDKKK